MDFDSLPDDNAPAQPQASAKPVMFDDLPDDSAAQDFDSLPDDNDKYSSTGQQIGAGLEGAAQGFAGPAATAAELGLSKLGVPGLSAEDQAGRANANPMIHAAGEVAGLGAGLLTGTGEAGLVANAAEHLAPEATTILGKVGSGIIKGALQGGLLQSGDEMSKAMLGQGDPEAPVSSALVNIGAAGLLGGATGGIFSGAGAAVESKAGATIQGLEDGKIGSRMKDFLAGVGNAAKPEAFPMAAENTSSSFNAGQKFYQDIPKYLVNLGTGYAVNKAIEATGVGESNPYARYAADVYLTGLIGPKISNLVGRTMTPAIQKIAVPVVMNALSKGETTGMFEALDHTANVAKGTQKITRAVTNLFTGGSQKAWDLETSDRDREKVKKYLESGGINQQLQNQSIQDNQPKPQGFAKGGVVAPILQGTSGMATHFPGQSMVLGAAKGRVANYLNSIKPQKNMAKLAFDAEPDQKTAEKKYNKVLDMAVNPLSILNKVKDGSLSTDDMSHFTALYPEVHRQLSKHITQKIIQQQLAGTKPNYKTRQGLSLFMGADLDSTFNPINIQAAQNVFATQKAQAASAPTKVKKGTSKLGETSKQFQTSQQAAEERQTREK